MKTKNKYITGVVLLLFIVSLFVFIPEKEQDKAIQPELLAFNNINDIVSVPEINPEINNELYSFEITKNTDDNELFRILEEVKKDQIDILFNNVERNENNEITNIEIVVSKGDLSEEFQDSNPNGIQPVLIKIYQDRIYVGYAYPQDDIFSVFSDNGTDTQMAMMQKMMQRQMQILQQLQSGSGGNDIFARFFGDDDSDEMMQSLMQQMMQGDPFVSRKQNKNDTGVYKKMEKRYIVNGKEMSEEEYKKIDKSKIRSLQIYQTQVVSKRF